MGESSKIVKSSGVTGVTNKYTEKKAKMKHLVP